MSLSLSRYNEVRNQLIKLHNILNNRAFDIWIAPRSLMTLEEIEGRFTYSQEGIIGDTQFFETHQLRKMKIVQIIDILDNLETEKDIGYGNPNVTVVTIYESIQEYIQLWCEMMRETPEFPHPSYDELRSLENVAYLVYGTYKTIKPYLKRKELNAHYHSEQRLNKRGLSGLGALFMTTRFDRLRRDDQTGFISYLDEHISALSPSTTQSPTKQIKSSQNGLQSVLQPTKPTEPVSPTGWGDRIVL